MANWYVVRTNYQKTLLAHSSLNSRGIECYLPRVPRWMVRAGRRDLLFPGYLFARFELEEVVTWIRYAPGVAQLLGSGSGPTALPDDFFEEMRERIEARSQERPATTLKAGDRVKIVRGPFRELDAIFEKKLSAAGRVRVLLETLSRTIAVDLEEVAIAAY